MTLRKKILPNIYIQVVLFATALYVWVQGLADPDIILMVFLSSALSLVWYAARHVPFPSLFHWFCLSYVALFYVYPILLPLLSISFKASDPIVAGYTFLAVGGVHLFVISYEVGRKKRNFKDPRYGEVMSLKPERLQHVVWGMVFVNVIGIVFIILDAGTLSLDTIIDIVMTSREDRKLNSGGLSLLGIYFTTFGALVYVLLPVFVRRHKKSFLFIVVILLIVEAILFFAYRMRTPIVLKLLAVAVGILYLRHRVVFATKERGRSFHRINSRRILIKMALFILLVGMLGIYIRIVRGYVGTTADLSFLRQNLSTAVEFALALDSSVGGDLGYTPAVFRVIEYVPDRYEYLGGQSYYRIFFIGIPRFVWPGKPENTGLIVGKWFFPGTVVQSNPPGVMGDLYINFGYAGIIGFILFGLMFARIDSVSTLAYYLTVATSFGLTFHFARGSFTNIVLQFMVLYLTATLIERYLTGKRGGG